jgi:hypothetical protein
VQGPAGRLDLVLELLAPVVGAVAVAQHHGPDSPRDHRFGTIRGLRPFLLAFSFSSLW